MNDLMTWLYDHYIKPQIESQPKDATEAMWFDRLDNELYQIGRASCRERV